MTRSLARIGGHFHALALDYFEFVKHQLDVEWEFELVEAEGAEATDALRQAGIPYTRASRRAAIPEAVLEDEGAEDLRAPEGEPLPVYYQARSLTTPDVLVSSMARGVMHYVVHRCEGSRRST